MEDFQMRQSKLNACAGFGAALVLSLIGTLIMSCTQAHGGHAVRSCVQCVAPVRYAAPVVAPYYYRVGAQLQQQSADTYGFRNSQEWSEFLQLKGYKAGVEQMLS